MYHESYQDIAGKQHRIDMFNAAAAIVAARPHNRVDCAVNFILLFRDMNDFDPEVFLDKCNLSDDLESMVNIEIQYNCEWYHNLIK